MRIGKQFRSTVADDLQLDGETNSFEFSFSSEEPVERYFGTEILSHKDGAMDMSRIKAGAAPLLWNHNPDQPIGMIETASVKSGRGYAKAKFFTTPFAQEKKIQVQEGLKNISFGYQIEDMDKTRSGSKNEPDQFTATKYGVFEISVVSIPADFSIGVGRSEGKEEIEINVIDKTKPNESKGVRKMEETTQNKTTVDVAQLRTDAIAEERVRIAAISNIGKQFKQEDLARQLIEGGKSVDEARAAVLEKLGQKQVPLKGNEAEVGLSEKEKREYSFLRAVRAQMFPNDRKFQEEAKFEREVSIAAQEKGGKAARGFMIPVDILRHSQRDLTVGTSTAGGNLVATELLSGSFIELLRNKSVLQKAGATVLNGLVGNISIPKASGAATAYWVAESGAPTESAQTIAQVSMSPKTVGAYNDYSRKLMLQSSIDVENFIRNDLANVIALEIDRVGLYGTGSSNQPSGIKTALSGGSNEKNLAAATPTWAEIIDMETKINTGNADAAGMKYIINAAMQGALKGAVKVSSYPVFILENGQMNGYPALMSNQAASGDLFFGDFTQLLMGFWSGLDLLVDPYSQSTSGTIRVVALQDCDIALRHNESFCRANDTP